MDNLISGGKRDSKAQYEKEPKPATSFDSLPLKEKLQTIVLQKRLEDKYGRIRRHQTWYLSALYYQGFQSVELNSSTNAFDIYERDNYYIENQYRKDAITIVTNLNRSEGEVTTRPSSDSPGDIAASRVGEAVIPVMHENINYKQTRTLKNLYKVLFGNAFIYVDYVTDRRLGTISTPRFRYEQMELPGMSLCPECGMTSEDQVLCPECGTPNEMMSPMSVETKVEDGFEEHSKGTEIAVVCSPLEIYCRPKVKGGLRNQPYLLWVTREDTELLEYSYPGLSVGATMGESDLAEQYLETLGNLPGNTFGDTVAYGKASEGFTQGELLRAWLRPQTFRGDKELEKQFPEGCHVVVVNGKVVEYRAESMDDHWTHEVFLPNPHTFYGDGLYDALSVQDQINETNSLLIQHIRYTTVGHKIFDANMIDIAKIENDPASEWIPANTSFDKDVTRAVHQLSPGALSQDVGAWLTNLKQSFQDMTGAFDPSAGKDIGANTPYSAYVFLAEKASGRLLPTNDFNNGAVVEFHRQLLKVAQENWIDDRYRKLIDNSGSWSFQKFRGADLGQGSFDVIITNTDMKPKTRAEQLQGLEFYTQMQPVMQTLSAKQKLRIEEVVGLPPETNPMSGQIFRAYRHIERIKRGETITPMMFIDEPAIQAQAIQEFLASEAGEQLAEENQEAFAGVYVYLTTLTQMGMMAGGAGAPAARQPQSPRTSNEESELAQSPVPDSEKVPMPPLPAGAR